MSFKDLLVTFVTSEEASITQRSAMSLGATLSIVLAVAILTIGLMAQSPHAIDVWQCCASAGGSMDLEYRWTWSKDCPQDPHCWEEREQYRYCCSVSMCGCTEWQSTGNYRVCCEGAGCGCYGRCDECL